MLLPPSRYPRKLHLFLLKAKYAVSVEVLMRLLWLRPRVIIEIALNKAIGKINLDSWLVTSDCMDSTPNMPVTRRDKACNKACNKACKGVTCLRSGERWMGLPD